MPSIISAGTTSNTSLNLSGDTTGNLAFQTNGTTTAVTIDTSQNVGIGTSGPSYKLDVRGSIGTNSDITVEDPSNTNTVGYGVGRGKIVSNGAGGFGGLTFQTYNGGFASQMYIDGNGKVSVGTTTTYARTTLLGNNTDVPLACWNNGGISGFFTMISFRNNAGTSEIGNVLRTNDNTISFNNTSDYRLKDNIQPMVGALDKVARLKPCTYTWKSDGSAGQGFIAHELQEIVPDAVTGEKDAVNEDGSIKPQGIDTSFLVATLTAAIQEQQAIIENLKARIETLEAK